MQAVSAERSELVEAFTGLPVRAFRRLVAAVAQAGGPGIAEGWPGRPWALSLADRVLVVAVYYRTNLTMRQLAPLFGVSPAAIGWVIDRHAPLLALQPMQRCPQEDEVLIVDGTLVPTRDRQVAASSKNYRHSTNVQVIIKADTRLVLAVGRPQPGNHNDRTAYTTSGIDHAAGQANVIGDGGCQGTSVLIPHRRAAGQVDLPGWKEQHNADHRRIRARVEHVFAHMKTWKILRDCRRKGPGVYWAATGIAHLHSLGHTH